MWMVDKLIRAAASVPGNIHIGVFGCVDDG